MKNILCHQANNAENVLTLIKTTAYSKIIKIFSRYLYIVTICREKIGIISNIRGIIIMPGDSKRYSVDNYDKLKPGDFVDIFDAFIDRHGRRLKIIRFLAKESKEEEHAKTRKQIAREIDITEQAALDHLAALQNVGVIVQIRSKDDDNKGRFQGPTEVIKYYLNVKNLIEISSILNAAMLGLPKDAAKKIKKGITRIFEQRGDKFTYGIYASTFLDTQGQILDNIRDVAYTYNEAQKDIVDWWCEVAQSSMKYYYYNPWLYSPYFANMTSKAYRSIADYAISGLNIAQNNFDAYIDISKNYSKLIADNINEISRTGVTSSKMFEPKSPGSLLTSSTETTPTTLPNVEYGDDESGLYGWRKLRDELTEIVQIARNNTLK